MESVKKASVFSIIVALVMGVLHAIFTFILDLRLKNSNPENYQKLIEAGQITRIFSWSSTSIFMLKIFIVVFIILVVYFFIRNKK